jgi:autotransporter-associated beta strand protein
MKNIFKKSHSADSGVNTRIDLIAMKNSTAFALLLTLLVLISNPLRLEAADVYWKGGQGGNPAGNGPWNGPNGTWTDIGGTTPVAMPGSTNRVVFSAFGVGAVNSTLGQDFTIERLGKTSSLNALIGGNNTLTIHQSTPDAPAIFSNDGAFFTITAPVVFAGSADEILVGGNSTVRIASLAGANNFTKNGTGLLEFTGNNSYSGSTTVQSGTLLVNGPGGLYGGNQSLWTGDRIRVESGATLALGLGFDPATPDANTFSDAQASSLVNNLIGNAGAGGFQDGSFLGLKTASNPDQTLSANITGAIGLVVSGFGSVTLNGTNSYTGGTLLQGGEVVASSSSSLGTGPIDFEGGILSFGSGFAGDISSQFQQSNGTDYLLGVNFNGTVTAASSFTSSNTSLTKYGFGALQLTGNNSFTAGVVVDGGKLVLGSVNAIGSSGNITFEGQTASLVFTANNTNDYAARFKNNTSAISIDTGGQTVTFSGNIDSSNTGGLEYYADGQLVLSGSNSYTGNTTIEGSSTYYSNDTNGLVVTNANSLGNSSGTIFFLGGGTLIYGANFTQDLSSRFSNSDTEGYFINTNGNNVTFASALTFESGALVKKGNGTLTLTGANTYGFGTHVLGGTLAGSTSSLQGGITIGEGAVLQFTQTSAGNYNGTLEGNGTLVKDGAGSLTLDGISGGYYGGSTIVNSGNLVITVTDAFQMSLTGDILNNATVQFNQTANGSYAGNLSGSGAFVKNGNASLTINGTSSYSGGTTVNSGTLIGSTSSLQGAITNNGVVNFQQNSDGTYSGAMGGSGSLVKSGWGSTVTLSGNNTYTGGTIIQDGTLAGTATSLQGAIEMQNSYASVVFNQVSTGTQSGVITGNGSFIKAGSGALTLVGNNTYSGSTSVREGTLSFGVGASLANATQSLGTSDDVYLGVADTSSGTLNYSGNATNGWFAKAITISGNGSDTIRNSGSGALILTGVISAGSNSFILAGGSNGIVVQGGISGGGPTSSMMIDGGKTTLQANNSSFSGDVFVVNGGNLTTGQANALPAKSVSLDATGSGGSILNLVGNQTVGAISGASTSQIAISLGALTVGSESGNSTFAGTISGNGVLSKSFANTLILTGNASHTGGTLITGGTLQIGDGGTTGSLSGNISNSGTLALNRSGNSSLSGNISGTGSLQQNGSGTVTLSGNNTYTGATTINSGILALGANNSVSTSSNMTVNGGIFSMGTRNQTLASFTLNDGSVTGNGTLSAGAFSLFNGTISAVISGNGSVTKNGVGTFTFNGSNTYSGKTAVRDGILAFNTVNASATAAQSLGTNATIDLGVAGASSATLNYTGGNGTLAKNINALGNGSNTVQNSGAGRLTLSGTLLKDGTVLLLLGGSGGISVSGNITGPSENSDLVLDGGVITLSGNNTYNGPTFLSNGTQLTIASATAVPGALVMDVSGSGSSSVALTTNASIASLEGAATSTVSIGNRTLTIGADTGSSTFNGTISGTGALVKSGNSSLTLNGNQTYTGGTILDSGTLVLGRADNTLAPSGNLTVNGTLLLGSNNQTVNRAKLTGGTISGTGLLTASDYALESGEITANLAGTANITKTTSGIVVLSGTNTQNGTIAINGGLLQFAKAASLFNGANASWTKQNITATANGTLGLNIGGAGEFTEDNLLEILQSLTANITNNGLRAGSGIALDTTNAAGGNFTFTGTIADSTGTGGGAISFEKLGSNTLVFSNNQSYTGNTTISGGTLSLAQSESLANSASLTIRNGTLALGASNNETIGDVTMNDGAITGEGALLTASSYTFDAGQVFANLGGNATLTKNSNGTASMYGDNSFTGNTTVNAGTLLFGKTSALYGGNSTLWTKSKLTFNSGGGLGLNVGGDGEFTAANLTALLGNLTSNVTTSGLQAGSFLALNTENAAGGNFSYTGNITNSTGAGGGALGLVKLGNGTLALSGSNSYTGGATVEAGKLQLQSSTNNSNITNNSVVEFSNDSGSIDYIGNMTGPGSVLKTGSSTLVIRNNMQHTGGTTVEGGSITIAVIPSLSVKPPASLGGNVHFVNQGLLTFANDSQTTQLIFPGVISGNASLVVSSGITQLTSSSTYTGNTTLTGGKLILANATTLPSGTDLSMSSAVMEMGVNSQTFGNTTIRDSSISGSGIMTVSSILISGSGALEPSIAGNASLTKGNGSTMGLVLKNKYNLGGAANSYTGNTTINGGILVFDKPGSLYGGNQSLWTPENIIVQSGAALSVGAGSGVFDGTQVAYLIDSLSTNITGGGLQAGSNFGLEVNGVFSLDTPFNDSTGLSGGSLGLVKTGAGTLTLNATNLFTGNLTILQGTVVLGNVTNPLLPTKDLKVNGGTFDVGDAQQTFNTVTLQTGTVAGNAGNITATNGYFVNSGLITANLKGNTYLEKDTQGAIVSLNGTNTYTGTTTVKSGTLELNKAQALYGRDSSRWNSGNISVNSGGSLTFKVGSSETFSESEISTIITGLISNRTSTSGGFKGGSFFVIDTSEADNGNFTVTESITDPSSSIGSLNVTKLGSGTLTLNASNSFSGTMLLNSGTLVLGHATDTLSDNASVSMSPSTSLLMGGNSDTIKSLSASSGAYVFGTGTLSAGNSFSFTSANVSINLSGSATLSAGGSTTLWGNNTYTGNTTVSQGTLSLQNVNALSGSTLVHANPGSSVQFSVPGNNTYNFGGLAGNQTLAFEGNALSIGANNMNTTYNATLSGTGSLTKVGNGTLTFTGNNTYTGGTTISGGTLSISSNGSITHASVDTHIGNGTLNLASGSISNARGNIGVNADNTGVANVSGGNWTNSNYFTVGDSGNGTLNLSGGLISNTGNYSYIGAFSGSSGVANVSGGNWTNGDGFHIGGSGNGTLNITGGTVSNVVGYLATENGSTGVVNVSGGTWSNSDRLRLGRYGNGTLNLTGGNVSIAGGAGNLTVAVNASSTGILNIGNGSTVGNLQAARVTAGNGTAIVNFNHSGNHSFSPIMEGNLTVNKLGAGTTILSGNNTYTGGTFITSGTLEGNTQSLQGAISNNASVVFNQTTNGTYSGVLSGSGEFAKTGAGTLTVSGNSSSFNGTAAINSGTVSLTGSMAGATTAINSGGTLTGNGSLGAVTINSGGILTGNGTAGAVTINSGGAINPGNSPGNLTVGNSVWNGGGIYNWELASANGDAGTGWDLIDSSGNLTITANSSNQFIIKASTTNSSGFDPSVRSASWKIAEFDGGISGFSADAFSINATGFANLPSAYAFGITKNGTALNFSYATIATWIGGTGNWTNTDNWETGFAAINGVAVDYAGTNGTSTNNADVTSIGGLTFTNNASGSFTLAGGALAIGTGGITNNSSSTQTVDINLTLGANQTIAANTANLFVSGNISGDASLTKEGNQKLVLSGTNTYTGTTTVNNGTLEVATGGSINNTSDIFVGLLIGDNGTLNLNGGSVSNAVGNLGTQVGSIGTASVSAGNWTNTGSLFVGLGGTGSLTINGTGHVTNEDGFVGHFSGSTGTVSVSGGTWTNNINLFIGNEGTGSLSINGTANVTSIFGYVGNAASGNGTVSVSGGTWTNSSNLDIGGAEGTGSLTINGTGTVIVGGTLSRGSNGTINLASGGTLQIGTGGATGTLSTDLANNGNLIFNLTGSSEDTHAISGTGTLTKNGTGTLILSGSNTYTGSTTLNAGTLEVNSSLVNTATTVNSGGTLAGVGSLGDVTINSGGAIAPGNSPGTITVGNLTLSGGAIYNWQVSSVNGTAGADWDLISSLGGLSLGANSTNQITMNLSTIDEVTLAGVKKATWEVGNFTTGITGFDKTAFSFNATAMTGNEGRYYMTLGDGNKTLVLNYKTAATWNTGSGNWTTTSQWENNFPPTDGDEVEFIGTGGISTNNLLSGNLSYISGISFLEGAGAYTVNGNTLQIREDGIINSSNQTQTIAMDLTSDGLLTVNADSGNITLTGVFSGNFQSNLDKIGNHTLTLTGNNTYEGGTIISAGKLALGGTAGAIIGNISVNSGATFAVNRTNDATISNLITGAGSFAQVGTSKTSITAVNTYTGGTTISSGTLWAKNSQALGTGNVLVNGGTLLTTSSQESIMGNQTLSIGGNLDWTSGKIAFYDTGTSPLSGNLTINVGGNFTVSPGNKTFDFSGVEALNSGNYTLVSTVGLVNISDVNFVAAHGQYTQLFGNFTTTNKTVVYTVTGATSGGANIENNGGPNTPIIANYNITVPTITVGVDNRVNALTFTGSNSLAIQSNGELTVTSGTLAVQSGSSVVSGGTLNTPGNFDKTGAGELDLDNTTNVNGIANVVEGLLSVNGELNANAVLVDPTATLGGAGVIFASNVVVNGNLSPGNSPGTLNVVGNLVLGAGSSTVIEIASPTNFDRIIVSGTATLGGTLNAVAYGGGTITPGARYDFLQAGSIDGEFDSLIAPDGLRIRFLNSGTVGTLLFGPASFVPYALNQNQINVAKALDIFVLATEGDAIVVGTALDSLTTEQFPAAFNQIMPGFYESLANIAIEQAFNQTQMLNQRISSVRLGAAGFQAIGGISQPLVHDKNGKSAAAAKDASPIDESATATNWNAWALGTGMFSRTTNLGSLQNYNNDAGGFLVGSDYRWSENFVTGLYGGYDYSYAEYNGGGSTKGNSFSFGTYASYAKDGYYADAVIGGGYTGFQTQRSIEFSTIDRTASADPNSGQFTAGLNLGKDFEVGKFTLGPIVGAQYTYAGIGSFTESGAESLDLSLGQQNANSLRSTLGGRIAYTWNVNQKIALIPEVRMFWQHEFLNNPRNINASLDGGSGAAFDYETTDPYRNSVFAGAGVTAQFGKNLSGSVFYNINFGSQTYQSNMVSAGLNFSF